MLRTIGTGPAVDAHRDLLAAVVLQAVRDVKTRHLSQKWKKDAEQFLLSPAAVGIFEELGIDASAAMQALGEEQCLSN